MQVNAFSGEGVRKTLALLEKTGFAFERESKKAATGSGWRWVVLTFFLIVATTSSHAQFSGSVQGTVQDVSKAVIPGATVTLVNVDTKVTQTSTSTASGTFLFLSLPPGNYTAEAGKDGFQAAKVPVLLETGERKDVPIVLKVGSATSVIEVSGQAPLLDTSDSRSQLTLNNEELEALPNATLNVFSSLDITPGVTGSAAGNTNYAPQAFVGLSANGRGENGVAMVLDGISTNDATRPGVSDISPNVDAIQEVSTQTNTYSVVNATTSAILIQMTTKAGTDRYHGSAGAYYQYQGFNARGEYGIPKPTPQVKYHSDNISLTFGGPIPRTKQLFFFFAYNPYLQLSPASTTRVETTDPNFINTYMTRGGNPSPEVKQMLQPYNQPTSRFVPLNQSDPNNYYTAAQVFNNSTCPASGTLGPTYLSVPCGAIVDRFGLFNGAGSTNAAVYNARLDKVFRNDRIYGSFIRSVDNIFNPAIVTANENRVHFDTYAVQADYTHTFSPAWLNEFTFGDTHDYGIGNVNNYYFNPYLSINGMNGYGQGGSNAFQEDIQRYRDLVTHTHGNHTISAGGDIVHSVNPSLNASQTGVAAVNFYNPYDAANDLPDREGNLSYNILTGEPLPNQDTYGTKTFDLFAEDVWRVTSRLTLNYGIRYDNFGNPYPLITHADVTSSTVLSTLRLTGDGNFQQQMQNAALVRSDHVFAHDLNWNWGPRGGFAYDLLGDHKWALRGGFGLYHDWFNLGNAVDPLSLNPPNSYIPTFIRGVTSTAPIFSVGTGNTYPYGYVYPSISGIALDAKGGVPNGFTPIGGVDRNLKSSSTLNWSLGLEHQILPNLTASVLYAGSHSYNLLYGGESQGNFDFGVDTNVYNGDTISHPIFNTNGSWARAQQERLNTSFGSILYNFNGARANYQSFVASVRGRFNKNGFMNVSYTRGDTEDNWQQIHNSYTPNGSWDANDQYGPSYLDVKNRISFAVSYQVQAFTHGNRFLRGAFSGYQVSAIGRFQTGTPFTVTNGNGLNLIDTSPGVQLTSANYASEIAAGHVTYISIENVNSQNVQAAFAFGNLASNAISGDYLGDGDNSGFPNVMSYSQIRNRKAYQYKCPTIQSGCEGSIKVSQFATPAFSTAGTQGNERVNQFREPGYGDVDLALEKNTILWRNINLRVRFDFFNAANRSNWNNIDGNLADYATSFGKTQGTGPARVGQLSGKITF